MRKLENFDAVEWANVRIWMDWLNRQHLNLAGPLDPVTDSALLALKYRTENFMNWLELREDIKRYRATLESLASNMYFDEESRDFAKALLTYGKSVGVVLNKDGKTANVFASQLSLF